MKKFLAIIALAGVFTACGDSSETTTSSDSTAVMEAPTPITDSSAVPNALDTTKPASDSIK